MIQYRSELILNIIQREHPELIQSITEKIEQSIPDRTLSDLSEIKWIVDDFSMIKRVKFSHWHNVPGQKRVTNTRDQLMAVILMFYHPEKLMRIDAGKIRYGLVTELSDVMGCDKVIISKSMGNAITAFNAYQDFKDEVTDLYNQLRENVKF